MKHFCIFTFKERSAMDIAAGIKHPEIGLAHAAEYITELPDDHYMCKRLPLDKELSKTQFDSHGMPWLVPKTVTPPSEAELLKRRVTGAVRYLSSTQVFATIAAEGGVELTEEMAQKREAAKELVVTNPELVPE